MSDLSGKFAALEEQLAEQNATIAGYIDTVESRITAVSAAVTQQDIAMRRGFAQILAAMHQNDPCTDCEPPLIAVPPTNETENPINEDKCKRTQAFLHFMSEVFTVLDTMSAFGVPFTPSLIGDAINQVIASIGNPEPVPLPSFPESIQIVGDGVNYIAGGFFVGDTLNGYFFPILFDLRDAIYPALSPADDQAAYNAVIEASSIPDYAKPLMEHAAYNAVWSYYFDPASDVDLTGYDGTLCAPDAECTTITSPIDTGTNSYVASGSTYQRVDVYAIPIAARIIASTTVECAGTLTISFGALVSTVSGGTPHSFSEMTALLGVSPRFLDSNSPSEEMQIEFCGLAPLE